MKLSRPGAAPAAPQHQEQPQEQTRAVPKGWGAAAAAANGNSAPAAEGQRERIQDQINPEANRSAFSGAVQDKVSDIRGKDYDAPQGTSTQPQPEPEAPKAATRTRAPRAAAEPTQQAPANDDAVKQLVAELASQAGTKYLRLKAVEIAGQAHMVANYESTADLFATADEILSYINQAAA